MKNILFFFIFLLILSGCKKDTDCGCSPPPRIGKLTVDIFDSQGVNITSKITKAFYVYNNGLYDTERDSFAGKFIDNSSKTIFDLESATIMDKVITQKIKYFIEYESGRKDTFIVEIEITKNGTGSYHKWLGLYFNDNKVDFKTNKDVVSNEISYSATFRSNI